MTDENKTMTYAADDIFQDIEGDDKNVLINQVGCFGINLGKIDFYFSNNIIAENSENIKV